MKLGYDAGNFDLPGSCRIYIYEAWVLSMLDDSLDSSVEVVDTFVGDESLSWTIQVFLLIGFVNALLQI